MPPAVVVDTMIASAWLGRRDSPRKTRWQPSLEQAAWVLPFTVVAEMRFGAEVAGWGRAGAACSIDSSPVPASCHLSLRSPTPTSTYGVGLYAPVTALQPRTTRPTGGWPPSQSPPSCHSPRRTRFSTASRGSTGRTLARHELTRQVRQSGATRFPPGGEKPWNTTST